MSRLSAGGRALAGATCRSPLTAPYIRTGDTDRTRTEVEGRRPENASRTHGSGDHESTASWDKMSPTLAASRMAHPGRNALRCNDDESASDKSGRPQHMRGRAMEPAAPSESARYPTRHQQLRHRQPVASASQNRRWCQAAHRRRHSQQCADALTRVQRRELAAVRLTTRPASRKLSYVTSTSPISTGHACTRSARGTQSSRFLKEH